MMSGDWIPVALPGRIRTLLPSAELYSLGGATEASIWSIYHPIGEADPGWSSVPYGVPLLNQQFHVLDEAMRPCPEWVPGHLYIAGAGLARGYLGDEKKTKASFLRHPATGERLYRTGDLARADADGIVHFLGRADSQIKSRGYRIELGEIEAALATVPGIRECAVVGVETGGFEGTTICCAYSVAEGHVLPATDVRRRVGELVPKYMVPARWAELEDLPHNVNGKIDRPALRERFAPADAATGGR
jgi:acyl-coenzyme A synthetase/AMP-(fatty) acid ligase